MQDALQSPVYSRLASFPGPRWPGNETNSGLAVLSHITSILGNTKFIPFSFMQAPSAWESFQHQALAMRIRTSLAGLTLLGLALILIYWYASAKIHYQRSDMKQDQANPTTRSLDAQPSNSSDHGYVVGMYYWEQLTMASSSLLDLQCWAARHKLVVVQPSLELIASYLKFTFDESLQKQMLELSDIYNMTEWNSYSKRNNLAPLVSRDEFLREIPHLEKEVILVEIHYEDHSGGHECTFNWKIESQVLKGLRHLQVSRKVCLKNNIVDVNKFDHLIFGELRPENVVVFIREWRGISSPPRVHINQHCEPERFAFLFSRPLSGRIMSDADAYAKKYLGGFGEYNAVVGRFEKAMDSYWTLSVATKKERIKALVQEAVERLGELNSKTNVTATFLAYDYGKYGSRTFLLQRFYQSDDVLRQFQQDVYSGRTSFNDWEQTFPDICHVNHTGYISLLQLVVASRARCLLRVGWSNFLDYVTRTYLRNHPTGACMECVPRSSKCGHYTIL